MARWRQFGIFLIAGGAAAFVNWTSRFVFNLFMPFGWAVILAYLTGMVAGFSLFSLFVFPFSTIPRRQEILRFGTVHALTLPCVWAIAYCLGEILFPSWGLGTMAKPLGHFIAIGVPAITSFFAHKFWTFSNRGKT